MDQHYVPRFYLDGFVDEAKAAAGSNREVWVADLERKRVYARSPRSIGYEVDFYEPESPKPHLPNIEDLYRDVENTAAPLLRKVGGATAPGVLTFDELNGIATFLALQVSRTPMGRDAMAAQVRDELLARARVSSRVGDALKQVPPERLPQLTDLFAKYASGATVQSDLVLYESILRPTRDLAPKIVRAGFTVLPAQLPLATNDHPAMLIGPQAARGDPLQRHRLHLLFALSPRTLLMSCLDGDACDSNAFHTTVEALHYSLILTGARRFIFAASKDLAAQALRQVDEVRQKLPFSMGRLE